MDRHLKPLVAVLAVFAFSSAAHAQRLWTVTGQEVPELAAVDEMMREMMQDYDIRGGSVAITKDGRLVYARGFSWDLPGAEPIQPTTLFRIGSIGKSITSIAIHQLIEDGLLSWDTRVFEILGLQPPPGRSADPWFESVTVDHMLTHTSGMYAQDIYTVNDVVAAALGVEPPPTKLEIESFIISMPFFFAPGTNWDYNNYGYIALGMLAEKVAGVDFPEYVFDHIFRAVGVGRTRMPHSLRFDLAPTETSYDGVRGDPYAVPVENAFAAGNMVMSAPDLARLYSALFDDPNASGLLRRDTIESMLSLPFQSSRDVGYGRGWIFEKFFIDSGHTVGWLTDPNDDLQVRSHSGGGSGVHTLALWRSDGIVFVWFTNKDPVVQTIDFPEIEVWPDHDLWESVGISRQPLGSGAVESWVPAVAHLAGAADSSWRSDVGLTNRVPRTNSVRLRYYDGSEPVDRELELAPGEARVIPDVVGWFGRSGSGALRVFSSEALTTTSRTYNQSPQGTFGQSLDGVTASGGLESGESVVLMQLREDAAARTNIGIHNQWPRFARVEIALYDDTGSLVTAHTRHIPPRRTVQLNRPYSTLGGRTDISSGYATVTVRSGQDISAYASVIDNATGDPTAIPMKSGEGSRRQWIAAAVHGPGAQQSLWRTDLCLLNRTGRPVHAEVVFHSGDGSTASTTVQLPAGGQTVLGDVVALLGGAGSGSVEISSDGPVMASSRTYNASPDGTFGLFLDAVPATATIHAGQTVWLPQLQQNSAFRTNIGLLNTGSTKARVCVTLFDGSGSRLATSWRTIDPNGWLQLQEPFARLAGNDGVDVGYATVEVASGGGVIAYASVIDNATNDGTAIAVKK